MVHNHQPAHLPKQFRLVIQIAGQSPCEVVLDHPQYILGREASESGIALVHQQISRQHGCLEWQQNGWHYKDLGSRNGSFFQGKRLPKDVVIHLQDGDTLYLGDAQGQAIQVTLCAAGKTQPPPDGPSRPQTVHVGTTILKQKATLIIGRDPMSDIHLPSPTISRRHAQLDALPQGGHRITDLKSNNGTFVNGKRISASSHLKQGDIIQIGAFRLVYDGMQVQRFDQRGSMRIDVRGLTLEVKGGRKILNNVYLSIAPCEFVALVGGSGAGKSTLMKAISGYSRATSGQVHVNGDDYYRFFDAYRALLGYVPQDDILHRMLPVSKALDYAARLRLPSDTDPGEIRQRIEKSLDDVEMREHREKLVENLSGGQRKRVSIASELLAEPTLFFLDEPTSGLDPGLEKKLMQTMRQLANQGRTILLVTHATENITACDHVVFMAQGRMIYFGPPKEAKAFFGVPEEGSFSDIYTRLDGKADPSNPVVRDVLREEYALWQQQHPRSREQPALSELWEIHYKRSLQYQRYVYHRLQDAPQKPIGTPEGTPRPKQPRVSLVQQCLTLTGRYFDLTLRDGINLGILLLQSPIIAGLLLLLTSDDALIGVEAKDFIPRVEATNLLFVFAAVAVWFGIINAAREITKESSVYRRERLSNLRIGSYIFSKMMVLSLLILLQNVALLLIVALKVAFPDETGVILESMPWLEIFVTMMLTSLAGTTLGLVISSFSKTIDQAISFVPLVLIPQILFAGLIFKIEEGTVIEFLSWLMISRWALDALGTSINLNQLCDLPNGGQLSCTSEGYTLKDSTAFPGAFDHSSEHLFTIWGILVVFIAVCLSVTAWLIKQRDREV